MAAFIGSAASTSDVRNQRIKHSGGLVSSLRGRRLDGVVAKPVAGSYESNKRVMLKIKHGATAIVSFPVSDGTRVNARLLAHSCSAFRRLRRATAVGVCASFTDKKRRELVEFLARYRKNALAAHPWKHWVEHASASGEAEHRILAARAAGAAARTCPGSRCVPNWSSKSLTSTCRAAASVTRRSFAGGARTRSRAIARMPSSKSCHHKSWLRFSPPVASPLPRAVQRSMFRVQRPRSPRTLNFEP